MPPQPSSAIPHLELIVLPVCPRVCDTQVHVIGFRALPPILHDMARPGAPIHATGVAQLEAAFAAVGEAAGTNTISDEFASRMSTEMDNKIINEFL